MNQEMFKAIIAGNTKKVVELLNSGLDVNVQDMNGWNALGFAARHGQIEIAELLIMRGADVNQTCQYGMTPLMEAAYHWRTNTAELLLQHKAEKNKQDRSGETALHLAAKCGATGVVKLLLECGADYDIENQYSTTPDRVITRRGIEDLFIEKKARDTREKIDAEKLKPRT